MKCHTCHIYGTYQVCDSHQMVLFFSYFNPQAPILKELYNIKLDVSINGFGYWILFPRWKVQIEILLIEIVRYNTEHVSTILKDSSKIILGNFESFPNSCWSNSAILDEI